ncbi:MAG: DUF418 domain-containing protein [Pseudomonadota bacterium]
MQPVTEAQRIESLDVLRGFALLGILLVNIITMGMHSFAANDPGLDLSVDHINPDLVSWFSVELFAEGIMRSLFSMLFGAGVLLFTTGESGKGAYLHYKRTFWLLTFGLFDAFILLWDGDILVTYALAGALLYWVKNFSAKWLMVMATILLILISLYYVVTTHQLETAHQASITVAQAKAPETLPESIQTQAKEWHEFVAEGQFNEAELDYELAQRRAGYTTAFFWYGRESLSSLIYIPTGLFWDALVMMLIGMVLYKTGVLQGRYSQSFYLKLMLAGFAVSLVVNLYEVSVSLRNNFDALAISLQTPPTYEIGRLAMALGYICLLIWLTHRETLLGLRQGLAAVGRMALTNYLMQSLFALIIFTGVGFALVGELSRASLYLVVFAIWMFQLWFSQWWLTRYRFGPVEWLWRALTYGERPPMVR